VRAAGKTGYVDIAQAHQDVERMSSFFQELGFDRVIKSENASYSDLNSAFIKVSQSLA